MYPTYCLALTMFKDPNENLAINWTKTMQNQRIFEVNLGKN
jgi:hypothetical protein